MRKIRRRLMRGGGAAAFTPLRVSRTELWWHVPDLSDGLVSSWLDRVIAAEFAQASALLQPTKAATSLGGRPGITADGARVLASIAAGAALNGLTQITIVWRMIDAITAPLIAMEYTASINVNNNGWLLFPNNGGVGRLSVLTRGGGAGFTSVYGTEALTSPAVVSIGIDLSVAGLNSVAFIRVNGVALALTSALTAAVTGALGNSALYLFGRGPTPTSGYVGTGGDVVVLNGIQQDADLAAVESYVDTYGKRDLGRVMTVGTSITRSNNAGTGGWRRYVEVQLQAADIVWTPVGPYVDGSTAMWQKDHGGLGGDTCAARDLVITAQVTAANPRVIIWDFGINDIGTGVSVATYQAAFNALLDKADAVVPTVKHIVQSIVVPTNAAGTTYAAEYAAANAWILGGMGGRARVFPVNVGQPVTSDFVHPIDGPTGYDVMGAAIYPVLLAA